MLARTDTELKAHFCFTAVAASASFALCVLAFHGALDELIGRWIKQEEYGHGFLIPAISAWLLWRRREAIRLSIGQPSWMGLIIVGLAIALHVVGELSALFVLSHLAFVTALLGIALCLGGPKLARVTFAPIIFLIFCIPLPYFIEAVLTWRLQLLSSEIGVAVIRLFQIPVYLEGNVIDLGHYKVQVVEACSGLRYLYPLLSLGFLAAYFFNAPVWQRATIFVSAIPITILMNSFRIGMVGVLVNTWGTRMADDMLHAFEGWIVFLACAGLLLLEIQLFSRFLLRKSFFQAFGIPAPPAVPFLAQRTPTRAPVFACMTLLGISMAGLFVITGRQEVVPERERFVSFPSAIAQWKGATSLLQPQIEHSLGLDDYVLVDYSGPFPASVNLYVAYYASQRKGVSPHSPIVCMPGGGWQITNFARAELSVAGAPLPFNRAVIEKNGTRQIVYYWFVQRGRLIANEYVSKWYLFADALLSNRTDGALVRLTTPIARNESEAAADQRLQAFIRVVQPRLQAYLPPQNVGLSRPISQPTNFSTM